MNLAIVLFLYYDNYLYIIIIIICLFFYDSTEMKRL